MPGAGLLAWRSWDRGALVLRVVLGTIMLAHGSQKVFGWFGGPGPSGTVQFIGSLGFQPAWLWGGLVMLAELGGGLMVLLGVATEVGALLIAIDMLVALFRVHLPRGFFNAEGGIEFPLALAAVAIALILGGPGKWALWNPFRRS